MPATRTSVGAIAVAISAALILAACGGSSTYNGPYTLNPVIENYTVGGTITGLTVGSVVLANGSTTVTVGPSSSSWVFATSFAPGTSYSVTVKTQPSDETCAVTSGGSGSNTGNVSNITVVCSFGEWTWEAGAAAVGASGVYGTLAAGASANVPGARESAGSWTDASSNFWLFGGVGYDATGSTGYLNDLWQFNPATSEWTWFGGGNGHNASGVYGTLGTAAGSNVPGARQGASTWTDSSGNLWLFGGLGYGSTATAGYLNDLWKYNSKTQVWTWVGGGSGDNATGVYGTAGTAAAGNAPGARQEAISWTDSSGNLWLFGGIGYASSGGVGSLNDLWQYNPTSGQWVWISGGSVNNQNGVYGTEGTAAAGNVPGARYAGVPWIDASGNLWMFGGYGYDSAGTVGKLSDLWEYVPGTGQWTWVSGEDAANGTGFYGTLGTASTSNLPGARQAAVSWTDSSGNLWLFGGVGYDAIGGVGVLNDIWQYSPSNKEWTWISGGYQVNPDGAYGSLATPVPGDVPGGRSAMSSWIDSSGKLWLFGGHGYDSAGTLGYLNDLWQYAPSSGT